MGIFRSSCLFAHLLRRVSLNNAADQCDVPCRQPSVKGGAYRNGYSLRRDIFSSSWRSFASFCVEEEAPATDQLDSTTKVLFRSSLPVVVSPTVSLFPEILGYSDSIASHVSSATDHPL